MLRDAAAGAGAQPQGDPDQPGLEVVRRADEGRSYLFVINHSTNDVELPASGRELVTGEPVDSIARVPAGAVRVIREDRTR